MPGGPYARARRPGRFCPALVGPAWPSGLARRGSRAWEVGKEPSRAEPGTGCGQRRARRARAGRRSRCRPHASPQDIRYQVHRVSVGARNVMILPGFAAVRTARATDVGPSSSPRPRRPCGREGSERVPGGELFEQAVFDGAGLVARGADACGVPQDVQVAGLAGDASASGAVVPAVVEVVLPDARVWPWRAVSDMRTVPADMVALALTVTMTVAPSARVLTGYRRVSGPSGRAGAGGCRPCRPGQGSRGAAGRRRRRSGGIAGRGCRRWRRAG